MRNEARNAERWPSAIVFDLDGTLVDSAGDLTTALNRLLEASRLPLVEVEEVIAFIGNGITALVQRVFMARGLWLEAGELAIYVARFKAFYEACAVNQTRPFSGVPELICDLRQRGIAVGICTNKEESLACSIVKGLGLRSYVDAVVGGLAGRPTKPSAIPLLETIANLGASPTDAIMVGDSEIDVRCARNARVPFIGVTFGYCCPPMSELGADVTITSYGDFEVACDILRSRRP